MLARSGHAVSCAMVVDTTACAVYVHALLFALMRHHSLEAYFRRSLHLQLCTSAHEHVSRNAKLGRACKLTCNTLDLLPQDLAAAQKLGAKAQHRKEAAAAAVKVRREVPFPADTWMAFPLATGLLTLGRAIHPPS